MSHSLLAFMWEQRAKLLEQTLIHTGLTFISLLIALCIGLPLGIMITRYRRLSGIVLGFAGVLQTIPGIALLGIMIPVLGIGIVPAIVTLFLYALLPIIRNTSTGIRSVDPAITEAARGLGMSPSQVLFKVELPLAMPVIFAGIRTATVINVGVATLAAYIAAGGLGEFIFGGISLNNTDMILAGAIPAALLALLFDFLLGRLQKLKMKNLKILAVIFPGAVILFSSFYALPSVYEGKMLAGFTPEFMGRRDGFLGLKDVYHFKYRTVVISDAVMYKALHEKKLDMVSGYSTDGRIKAFDLLVLHDDRHIFPPYYAAPVVREDVLEKYPALEGVLNLLAGKINDSVMTSLNYRADYLKQAPEKIAKDFLISQGLYKDPAGERQGMVRIGSKIFDEQYILAAMYTMLIKGYTRLDVNTKSGLGGTKICFDALTNNQIDMFPEYTGTGLLVELQAPAPDVEKLGGDKDAVYTYVKQQFHQRFGVKWLKPLGFNNTYAVMMRKTDALQHGIVSISDLIRKGR